MERLALNALRSVFYTDRLTGSIGNNVQYHTSSTRSATARMAYVAIALAFDAVEFIASIPSILHILNAAGSSDFFDVRIQFTRSDA